MIRILVVADIRLYREGLAQTLGREEGLTIAGAAADLEDALKCVRAQRPDVVLIDQAMPDSLAAVRAIGVVAPKVKVVALAVRDMDRDVIACAEAGVAGYVPREAGVPELISTIHSVAHGELLCSPRVAATLLRRVTMLASGEGHAGVDTCLTGRELEILGLLERGLSNKDIARHLGIEVATAKNHVHNILGKLHVRGRGQAAARMRGTPRRTVERDARTSGGEVRVD